MRPQAGRPRLTVPAARRRRARRALADPEAAVVVAGAADAENCVWEKKIEDEDELKPMKQTPPN